jgi:FPC/CPF motif-containing protein YcgG
MERPVIILCPRTFTERRRRSASHASTLASLTRRIFAALRGVTTNGNDASKACQCRLPRFFAMMFTLVVEHGCGEHPSRAAD